ncbi:MAG: Crp/Fnr family transcriptional regulator [Fusobacteriaceae bacterium]|jgi:CRP-like cAMP-binding protein|nr:Crp/Fnr family transcriptional regulator [Fusobacteriaceae bacterium]
MKITEELLAQLDLFADVFPYDLQKLAQSKFLSGKKYPKGSDIFTVGDPVRAIGVVVSGKIRIYRDDFMGNRAILAELCPGDTFAEAFVCAGVKTFPVNVSAKEKTEILFFDYDKFSKAYPADVVIGRVSKNLAFLMAQKNIYLNEKNHFLAKRTIREKILSFLTREAQKQNSPTFVIPFNRQELADYLSVERSALSVQLGKLRAEKVLDFHKNGFTIYPKGRISKINTEEQDD